MGKMQGAIMINVIRRDEQADGQFNGGAVLEKRPVVYQDEKTFPYSNLFYWAHAWSEAGSTIGLHPHQGFEILSFILKGEIEHYDTKNKSWMKLKTGDVQIIRSGNGISHAEKLLPHSSIFQIWFDPNLDKTLSKPATYDDYTADSFPVEKQNGMTTKTFIGNSAPIVMDTEGIVVKELMLEIGEHQLTLSPDKIYSLFLMEGTVSLDEVKLEKEDFAKINGVSSVSIQAETGSKLFIIESPLQPSYQTYIQLHG
jgi:redox-sensitive bicupin YhaK (pirin superfamily)